MGCTFCATGQMGFRRDLTEGEIFEQVARFAAELRLKDERLSNVVFSAPATPPAHLDVRPTPRPLTTPPSYHANQCVFSARPCNLSLHPRPHPCPPTTLASPHATICPTSSALCPPHRSPTNAARRWWRPPDLVAPSPFRLSSARSLACAQHTHHAARPYAARPTREPPQVQFDSAFARPSPVAQ